jgi:hypothetical protein
MGAAMSDELLAFNGVDATTGQYLLDPMGVDDLSRLARGETIDPEHLKDLKGRRDREAQAHYGVVEGADPKDLSQTGWGVIFPANHDPAIREALAPLLDLRKRQASAKKEQYYREYIGPDGYRPGETKTAFLARLGVGSGPADPEKASYYMLLVGGPEDIPYGFQYQLDVQYAVGRIAFDTPEEYAHYAQSVVAAETGGLALARRAAFFGVANPDDRATGLSSSQLVAPLAQYVTKDQPAWAIDIVSPEEAHKARLTRLLGGDETPALLFTASHGMGFPNGDARQFAEQGALICQDWPGPSWNAALTPDFYFSGGDIAADARLHGLIGVHFACFGAGTPKEDDFPKPGSTERATIAPRGFVARLPSRMLSHPKGGALAVIGHVERAWGYSFYLGAGAQPQLQTFQSTMKRLMEGHPVGSALEYFNGRYAELSSDLTSQLEDIKYGKTPDDAALASLWTANNDARSFAVIGDPAVRLCLAAEGAAEARPGIEAPIEVRSVAAAPTQAQPVQAQPAEAQPTPPPPPQPPAPTLSPSPPPPYVVATHEAEIDYGLLDTVGASLQNVRQGLGAMLQKAVESLTTTQVLTYVSGDLGQVTYANDKFQGANLRAMTRLTITGDTLVCVPESADGKVDDALWKIHCDNVDKALANRAQMVKSVTELLGVLNPLKL